MSKYYGQVQGAAETVASRRGYQEIKASVQSYDGSVIVKLRDKNKYELEENPEDIPMCQIYISDTTDFYGERLFMGTIEELKQALLAYTYERSMADIMEDIDGNVHNS